jgi:hypothetical protein
MTQPNKPWTSGPRELLEHADTHLRSSSAFDHRIAFISVDNAVEVMIRTFLGLPKRARGREGPSRKALEAAFGFPDLLDLLEEYADDLIRGIELGDIEWFHRIRNSLYHEGNGITVDKKQLDTYRAVALVLFENLFDVKYAVNTEEKPDATMAFLIQWGELENRLKAVAMEYTHNRPPSVPVDVLVANGVVDGEFRSSFDELRRIRNSIAHGQRIPGLDIAGIMTLLKRLIDTLPPWKPDTGC